jgi:spore maturation protein CgeB
MISGKLLAVILKNDYGDPRSGLSYEYNYFYRTLEGMFTACRLFDYSPYLERTVDLQADVLAAAEEFRPDVVFFVLFQDQFAEETLDRLKERYLTVNWFCDDQWRFEDFSRRYCRHFSYVVTTDRYALKKYRDAGFDNAILSQWATRDVRAVSDRNPGSYGRDVSFVGMSNAYRRWLIRELEKRGVEIECYGTGWPRGRVPYEEVEVVFQSSKINLNISNSRSHDVRYLLSGYSAWRDYRSTPKVKEQIKGRHFEIPACGGFQLTNYVEFLEDYFRIGEEIAIYNVLDDLVDKIRFYLDRESLRQEIARAGNERTRREHTYEKRFQEIFRAMGVLG